MRKYRVIDSKRKRTQDRGASVIKKEILEYAPTCALIPCFLLDIDILYNILKDMVCHFANELFKCLWAYRSEQKCFRIFEMV